MSKKKLFAARDVNLLFSLIIFHIVVYAISYPINVYMRWLVLSFLATFSPNDHNEFVLILPHSSKNKVVIAHFFFVIKHTAFMTEKRSLNKEIRTFHFTLVQLYQVRQMNNLEVPRTSIVTIVQNLKKRSTEDI